MTRLVIGNECIEICSAIKAVKSNIRILKDRIENVAMDCAVGQKMFLFYANEMNKHQATLKWLSKYETMQ